jgi:hypothetical protein
MEGKLISSETLRNMRLRPRAFWDPRRNTVVCVNTYITASHGAVQVLFLSDSERLNAGDM